MEFNVKLQELRKQKGITQEELANSLYVSRTAVSKWESNRGYPNIDSLKGIAAFFGVTVDSLLSGEELLTLAAEQTEQKQKRLRDLIFGLLDVSVAMLLFLPIFGQNIDGQIFSVSLLSLTEISTYLKVLYFVGIGSVITFGIATLAFQHSENVTWVRIKSKISLFLNAAVALLFVISLQAYAATFLLVIASIKALSLIKWN